MFHLLVFRVLLFSVAVSAGNQARVSSPPLCTIHNNFYAGPNKKVENLLTDMKKQLDELKRQVELMTTKGRARFGYSQHYENLGMSVPSKNVFLYDAMCRETTHILSTYRIFR